MILVDTDIFFEIFLQQFDCTVGCKYVEDRQIGWIDTAQESENRLQVLTNGLVFTAVTVVVG